MANLNKFKGFKTILSRHYAICFLCVVSILISSAAILITHFLLLEFLHIVLIIVSSINLTYNAVRIIVTYKALKEFRKISMEVLLEQGSDKEL